MVYRIASFKSYKLFSMANINMSGISDSLKILNQKSVSMADLSKVYKTLKGKFEGLTWQGVIKKQDSNIK